MSAEQSKKFVLVCAVCEIKWECDIREFHEKTRDFPIIKSVSDWLYELTTYNVDDITKAEREWHILHRSPGHLLVFLSIFTDNITRQVQYPFKEPDNRPLPSAKWTEQLYEDYWDFVVELREKEAKPLFSKLRVRAL